MPTWYELVEFASFLLRPLSTSLSEASKAALSVEIEQRAAGSVTGLASMSIKFPAFSIPKMLALPAMRRMQWSGNGRLVLVTDSAFDKDALAENLLAEAWSWDEEREGCIGSKRKRVEKTFFAICDEASGAGKSKLTDKTSMSLSLETTVLTVRTPVQKWSKGFRHCNTSAALPPCTLDGPAKLDPATRTWVARSTPDPTHAQVSALYDHGPWAWWG